MVASRLLSVASRNLMKIPSRGKALENWARPSIDELGVPTEPWKKVYDARQKKYMAMLLAGTASLAGVLVVFSNTVFMNPEPKHLMKN